MTSSGHEIYDVIIVGAGVVGAMTARELSRFDLKVLVIESEPDAAMGATKANSAIVHGGYAEGPETLKGRLCAAGRHQFSRLEDELQFGFRAIGSLVVSYDTNPLALQSLYDQGLANGLKDLELWGADRALEHEPHLRPGLTGALWCAGAGVCSPWDLTYAALENAMANGVELQLGKRIVDVQPSDGHGWQLSSDDQTWTSRYVLNAAGWGSARLDRLAGLAGTALSARTGQYVVFGQGSGSLVRSVIFPLPSPLGKGILVTPTYQNNLLVGPDANNESKGEDDELRHTDSERLQRLIARASAVIDGIDHKKAIRSFAGVRAGAVGGDFVLGAADPVRLPGWYHALGIQSPGITASPAIAQALVSRLERDGLPLRHRPDFDPARRAFAAHLSRRQVSRAFDEVQRLTQLPPGDPHRVVCRCEQVTEADLADACDRAIPVTTLDAIKRRTRAGMGWCQGQFCRPRVMQWLERRLGQPVPEQTDVEHSRISRVEGSFLRDTVLSGVSTNRRS